ncbi:AAA-like domain-containing protein [Actinacidiphila rubida]|uniref:AAA-like domain-containing protein n=1 Tax=Actinacidiphila rubida TaxID=310780 RepID=A0A1H8TFD0_9ACTN|nr:ATP-binding protein [Actinacidiphila rubida]SEO89581.1 AAA-like domain-containing protein [Actinacidiphila rubida]
MRLPLRHLAGNVIWTVHGTAWALWRVQSGSSAHASNSDKHRRLAVIESLIKSLTGESMLLSLCPSIDPASVVRKMTADVDLDADASDRYVALAQRVLTQLETLDLTGRTDWLAVPLPPPTRMQAVRDAIAAGRSEFASQLGLLPAPVRAREEIALLEQAAAIAASWPAALKVRPASEAEIMWIYGHAARRGTLEPLLPESDGARPAVGRSVAAWGQAVLTEGGLDDVDQAGHRERAQGTGNPFKRRWLQVHTPFGTSYQVMLALSQMPEEFVFPGSEYLAALDSFHFPVDWVVRLKVTPGNKAEAQSRRQARELAGQPEEYGNDPAGVPASVDKSASRLDEYRERLTASQTEVEVQAMPVLSVWGATPAEAQARADALIQFFGGNDYTFAQPLGAQEALWYGMLPGARTPRVMLKYAQVLLARDFAMGGPFGGSALGDDTGQLYGLQLSGGGIRPVLTDWTRGPRAKASASAAFIGELGSGKSTAMKAAVYAVLAAGRRRSHRGSRGRAVIVDRTPQQEWVRFANACPGTTQVITVDQRAEVSLDPLRIFARHRAEAQRFTESFLTLLLGIGPMSEMGMALSEAIEAVLARPAPSMAALMSELQHRGAADPDSLAVLRKLTSHQRKDLARAVFDPSLPVVDVARADAVVFSVPNLSLPSAGESAWLEHGAIEYEKIFGRAAMYLIAAICRQVAFDPDHPGEFCAVVWDECWWLTASTEGLKLLLELVRDGRKHNAAVLVGSHDANDIGPADTELGAVVRGLFRRRFLFRQSDGELARRGLAFLDLDPNDADLHTLVTTGLSPLMDSEAAQALRAGECLHRDLLGRVGGMQVLIPNDDQAAAAIHSDPTTTAA